MSPASVSILLWSLGQFGPRLRTISIDGRPFDGFLHRVVEHAAPQSNQMTAEQLTGVIMGQILCRRRRFRILIVFFRVCIVNRIQTT